MAENDLRKACRTIDNLLSFITMKEMMSTAEGLEETQDILGKHQWVKDSLVFLRDAKAADPEINLTLAHSDWIARTVGTVFPDSVPGPGVG